jgi:hypothetical protein
MLRLKNRRLDGCRDLVFWADSSFPDDWAVTEGGASGRRWCAGRPKAGAARAGDETIAIIKHQRNGFEELEALSRASLFWRHSE